MKNAPIALLKRHPIIAYFVLAYAISWAVELPLAASAQGWLRTQMPPALHYLASFGPMLAALIVTAMTEGRHGIWQLLSGLFKWRVGLGWLLFAILSPIALFAVAAIAGVATTGKWPDLALLGEVDYLPYLGVAGAFILWLLTFGVGEELGWRGFALPRLQTKHSALTATLILGLVWACWHVPAFFYKDTYRAMGLGGFPLLLLFILAASPVFTWLYNSTRGSLLMVIVFHATFDFLSVSRAGGGTVAAVMSAGVMIWAVLVVILFKPKNLSHEQKRTA